MYNTLYIPGLESVSDFQHYYHRFLKVLRLFSSDHQIRSEDEKQVPKIKIYKNKRKIMGGVSESTKMLFFLLKKAT